MFPVNNPIQTNVHLALEVNKQKKLVGVNERFCFHILIKLLYIFIKFNKRVATVTNLFRTKYNLEILLNNWLCT